MKPIKFNNNNQLPKEALILYKPKQKNNDMKSKEIKLISKLLEMASDEFSNHGCNDVEDSFYEGWTIEERIQLVKEFHEYNGDPEEFNENFLYLGDDILMSFFAHKLLAMDEYAAKVRTETIAETRSEMMEFAEWCVKDVRPSEYFVDRYQILSSGKDNFVFKKIWFYYLTNIKGK